MIFTVSAEHAGQRLDLFLAERWAQAESRSEVQRIIKARNVRIDGLVVSRASTKVGAGQVVRVVRAVSGPAKTSTGIVPGDMNLNVVYEDNDIALIDKPAGMTVHPGAGHDSETLVNAAVARWPRIADVGEPDRPGVVHRLDRDTSGLLVIALTGEAYSRLSEMIRNREITRIYTALVHGHPESSAGVVDAPIGRDPHHRTRQAVVEDGRPSRTHYRVVSEYEDFSLLEVRLETGRMHQIRVHLDAIGHPVAGDRTYGKRQADKKTAVGKLKRQFLHASKLEFGHPVSGKPLSIASELPEDLDEVITELTASNRR
ncbi:MAG: RluA family pseudouridine synthase [Chloroflexi bacterium]|nr:RluA family pseudouridine synthase [Chloroflexota bacterium]